MTTSIAYVVLADALTGEAVNVGVCTEDTLVVLQQLRCLVSIDYGVSKGDIVSLKRLPKDKWIMPDPKNRIVPVYFEIVAVDGKTEI